MTTSLLRYALAFALAGGFALVATDASDAKSKRGAYKKPRAHALVVRPYAPPPYREPECVTQYDSRGQPVPAYFHCEAAFRRLYPPR